MEQFLAVFKEQRDDNKKLYEQFHLITKELAITSTNLKNVTEQISKTNSEQKDIKDDVNNLKSDRDKALGGIFFLKIVSGLISAAIIFSFSWVYNTQSWIAKIDQWKTQIESK